ncbi:MAG TPA: CDP-alcohol phosphatidyltransferase family protein [bacterium]|nr:CDP-alcohol phosphatidyltransferase family protein [bacterium]
MVTFTVANALTVLRLVLTPFFVAAFILSLQKTAFVLFCVAGFTDLIDGSVARLLNQRSKGGAILDPLADKLLMQSCFALLAFEGLVPLWFFLLAFARDATIVSGIIYLERKKADLPYSPILVSKIATLVQLAVAILGLLLWWKPHLSPAGIPLQDLLVWSVFAASVFIIASGFQYVRIGFELLRKDAARREHRLP